MAQPSLFSGAAQRKARCSAVHSSGTNTRVCSRSPASRRSLYYFPREHRDRPQRESSIYEASVGSHVCAAREVRRFAICENNSSSEKLREIRSC